jgi:hypothetical protein
VFKECQRSGHDMHLKAVALFGKGILVKCPDACVHELLWAGVVLLGSTGVLHGSHADLAQQFIDNPSGTLELLTRAPGVYREVMVRALSVPTLVRCGEYIPYTAKAKL